MRCLQQMQQHQIYAHRTSHVARRIDRRFRAGLKPSPQHRGGVQTTACLSSFPLNATFTRTTLALTILLQEPRCRKAISEVQRVGSVCFNAAERTSVARIFFDPPPCCVLCAGGCATILYREPPFCSHNNRHARAPCCQSKAVSPHCLHARAPCSQSKAVSPHCLHAPAYCSLVFMVCKVKRDNVCSDGLDR